MIKSPRMKDKNPQKLSEYTRLIGTSEQTTNDSKLVLQLRKISGLIKDQDNLISIHQKRLSQCQLQTRFQKVLIRRSRDAFLAVWSGFKIFEENSYIDKSDEKKGETLIMLGQQMVGAFSQLLQFQLLRRSRQYCNFCLKNVTQPF